MCNPEKKEKNTQLEIDVITYSLLLFSLRNSKVSMKIKEKKNLQHDGKKINFIQYTV